MRAADGSGPRLADLAELVRAPAALTVPGDTLTGGAAAGWPFGLGTLGLGLASTCLYWAGMALNDFADREIDARERPERPIPSGRVTPDEALGVAVSLTLAGLSIATIFGGRQALAVAAPLAACVWAYDLVLKPTPAGPPAMAACRSLDVLLGAGSRRLGAAAPSAIVVGSHTLAVTLLSRGEVGGSTSRLVSATLAMTAAVTTAAAFAVPARAGIVGRLAGLGFLGTYATTFGGRQLEALDSPEAGVVRRAVVAGIHGHMPLQASLAARAGALHVAVPVAGAFVLARRLSRRISPT
jgi:4-hydroxybenzoate polyprenyltransferase